MQTRERYERLARQWDENGRQEQDLRQDYGLIAMRCWAWSAGGKAEGPSELLRDYIKASEAVQRVDWLDAYFSEPEHCRQCGERYRFENVAVCTACSGTYCYRCAGGFAKAPNGNTACPCGNGELVG